MRYLTQPVNFTDLMSGGEHLSCTLQQSIAQRIHIILVTNLHEYRSDREFGCIIWEHDFENIANINLWKDTMAKAVKEVIVKYETRLNNIKVTLDLTEEEFKKEKDTYKKIKRRVDITIRANLKRTNESFYFQEVLYISPVWID